MADIAVTPEEMRVAYDGPAIAANRVLVSVGPGGVRIAFTEQFHEPLPRFRMAVIMPIQDAISLKNVLAQLLTDIEKQIAAAQAPKIDV